LDEEEEAREEEEEDEGRGEAKMGQWARVPWH